MQTNNDSCLFSVFKWFAAISAAMTLLNMFVCDDYKYVVVPITVIVMVSYPIVMNDDDTYQSNWSNPNQNHYGQTYADDSYAYTNYWDKQTKGWKKYKKDVTKKCKRNFKINIYNDNNELHIDQRGRTQSEELHQETQENMQ